MADDTKRLHDALSDVANALQTAAPLATQLRRDLAEQAQDAVTLEAAIDRAVQRVQPGEKRRGVMDESELSEGFNPRP